jgi:hypothetical protein
MAPSSKFDRSVGRRLRTATSECTLDGEINRRLHEDPSLRRRSIQRVLTKFLDDEGGPLMYTLTTEAEQRSFDSTFLPRSREPLNW